MEQLLERRAGARDVHDPGGGRGPILAVVTGHDDVDGVLRVATLLAWVESRPLKVLLVRRRPGWAPRADQAGALQEAVATFLSVAAAGRVEVDHLVVRRRAGSEPRRVWREVVGAADRRAAAVVVVPEELASAGTPRRHDLAVVTVPDCSAVR